MKNLLALLLMVFLGVLLQGQTILKSTNEKISGKAAAGTWIDYSIDPTSGDVSFTFETKKTKKKSLYETYSFDNDLGFKGMQPSELTASEAAGKFVTMKGGPEATKLLRVGKNLLTGQMKMELGKVEYWYAGRALLSRFNTEQKVKPKGEDGSKLLLIHSRTEEQFTAGSKGKSFFGQTRSNVKITSTTTNLFPISYNVGDVMAIVYEKSGRVFQDYAFLVYDASDLSRKLTKKIPFETAYRPLYVRDMPNGDFALIFAPITKKDIPKAGKMSEIAVSDKPMFKYLRINTKGETVHEVDFELAKNRVGMPYTFSLIPATDPEDLLTYLVGYGNPDFLGMGSVELAASQAATHGDALPRMTNMTGKKLNTVIMGKFAGNKLAYLNTMSPAEFWAKGVAPAGAKVDIPDATDAGKFFLSHLVFVDAGEIEGKDHLVCTSFGKGIIFDIQLDGSGNIEKVYAPLQGKVEFQEGVIFPKENGELVMLYTHQPKAKDDSDRKVKNDQRSIEACIINPSKGTVSAPKSLLPSKHYVDTIDPLKAISSEEVLILGHTSRKDLTLSKVRW